MDFQQAGTSVFQRGLGFMWRIKNYIFHNWDGSLTSPTFNTRDLSISFEITEDHNEDPSLLIHCDTAKSIMNEQRFCMVYVRLSDGSEISVEKPLNKGPNTTIRNIFNDKDMRQERKKLMFNGAINFIIYISNRCINNQTRSSALLYNLIGFTEIILEKNLVCFSFDLNEIGEVQPTENSRKLHVILTVIDETNIAILSKNTEGVYFSFKIYISNRFSLLEDFTDSGDHLCQDLCDETRLKARFCTLWKLDMSPLLARTQLPENLLPPKAKKSKWLNEFNLTLTIECNDEGNNYITYKETSPIASKPELNTLQRDMVSLYRSNKYTDAVLSCADGIELPIHKNIVCARSEVFEAMFIHPMQESTCGRVQITDFNSKTINKMLEYIYTRNICLTELEYTDVIDLYQAADKYDIILLQDLCSKFLASNVSTENVCDLLSLSDLHGSKDLKQFAMKYLAQHKEVLQSEKWQDLIKSNVQLGSECVSFLSREMIK